MERALSRRQRRESTVLPRVQAEATPVQAQTGLSNTLVQAALSGDQQGVAPLVAGAMVLESAGVSAMGQALTNSTVQRYMALRHGNSGSFDPEAGSQLRTALHRAGRALPQELQGRVEQAFGDTDFGGVRLHTDSSAAQAAEGIQARAFTVGQDIFFARDAFHPESSEGRELLLHELTHVKQHLEGRIPSSGGAGEAGGLSVSAPSDATEREAVATSAALAPVMNLPMADLGAEQSQALDSGMQAAQDLAAAGAPMSRLRDEAQVARLVERIVQAVAEKETRRRTQESSTGTSAGTKASYASQVQATTIWAIDAVRGLPQADRDAAQLSNEDLNRPTRITSATQDRHRGVMSSGTQTQEQFLANPNNQTALRNSGLSQNDDLPRMFAMRDMRAQMNRTYDARLAELDGLETAATTPQEGQDRNARNEALRTYAQTLFGRASDWAKGRARVRSVAALSTGPNAAGLRRSLRRFIASDEAATEASTSTYNQVTQMDQSSLRTYLTRDRVQGSPMWGEDRAGWQRKAAELDPAGVRLRDTATADNGLSLARSRIGAMVRSYLTSNPEAGDEEACRHAAQRHNPHEANYANDVVANFNRMGAAREARGLLRRDTQLEAPRSAGRSLPGGLARKLASKLGSLNGVQVHTDAAAHKFAQQANANAVTVGKDIYFAHGAFDPGSDEGLERIAHEVHHAILGGTHGVSQPGDVAEREAERFARGAFAPELDLALRALGGDETAPAVAERLDREEPGAGRVLREQAPVEQAPVEQASVEQAPVDLAPVDVAPLSMDGLTAGVQGQAAPTPEMGSVDSGAQVQAPAAVMGLG